MHFDPACVHKTSCLVRVNQKFYISTVSLCYQLSYCPTHRWQFLLIMGHHGAICWEFRCYQTVPIHQFLGQFFLCQPSLEIILSASQVKSKARKKYLFIQSKISNTVAEIYNLWLAKRKKKLSKIKSKVSLSFSLSRFVSSCQTRSKSHLIHVSGVPERLYTLCPKCIFTGGNLQPRKKANL